MPEQNTRAKETKFFYNPEVLGQALWLKERKEMCHGAGPDGLGQVVAVEKI
jgi:hypothetical protein